MGPTCQVAAKEGVGHLPDVRLSLRQLKEATPKPPNNHLTLVRRCGTPDAVRILTDLHRT